MRVVLLITASVAALAAALPAAPGEEPSSPPALRVGLIDMTHVFQNSRKFAALTESLTQREVDEADARAQTLITRIEHLRVQLTGRGVALHSDVFDKLELELATAQHELAALRRQSQRELLLKEAEIYKSVYLDAEEAVRRYARFYNYTLVLRFQRHEVDASERPREILAGVNQPIVYFQSHDDITGPILDYLNDEWRKASAAAAGQKAAGGRTP